jgi:ATP-dependent exoDNAse (exonuclease V) alpha subunit
MELMNVVLLIPPNHFDTNEDLNALVYTAMTRAKENLIILNTMNVIKSLGKNIQKME